jgi:uncharacterized protein YfbU (UPF0304 family)
MKISKKDRIILINQYRVLSLLNKDEADHYNELIEILENGYEIFYSMIDEWLCNDMPTEEGQFVLNILDLYRAIEDLKRSSQNEKLHGHVYSHFAGFDGNNETKYMGFARFLINKQEKFSEQKQYFRKNDNLNSHLPMIDKYKRMLEEANSITSIWQMTVENALKILDA